MACWKGGGPSIRSWPVRNGTSSIRRVVVVSALMVGLLAGCSSSGKSSTASSGSSGGSGGASSGNAVSIKSFKFAPTELKVKSGTKVTWTNQDSTTHTATSDDSSAVKFDSKDMKQAKTFSFSFAKAGTYKYHCTIHTYMTGTVTVS